MPLIINGIKKQIPCRTGRGGAFDSAVKLLASSIAKFRSAGCRDIRKLVKQLNDAGLKAPSGRPFSYGTLRRVLIRQGELKLWAWSTYAIGRCRRVAPIRTLYPSVNYTEYPGVESGSAACIIA